MARVIIDTDDGVDDAWALAFALSSDDVEIRGITSVFGNVEASQAALNALHILELCRRSDVPVFSGSAGPLLPVLSPDTGAPLAPTFPGKVVHGARGLGEYDLPTLRRAPSKGAVRWLVDTVLTAQDPVEIVAIGPLTNIALASLVEPEFPKRVGRLIFMGGVTNGPGNVLPLSTANIWNDPEAALVVFHAGYPKVVMVGQDVTRYSRVTKAVEERVARAGGGLGDFLLAVSGFYSRAYGQLEPRTPGYPVHDLMAVAYLVDPAAFVTEPYHVTVETAGRVTRGQTVADKRQSSTSVKQMEVCVEVDVERVFDTFIRRLDSAGGRISGRG